MFLFFSIKVTHKGIYLYYYFHDRFLLKLFQQQTKIDPVFGLTKLLLMLYCKNNMYVESICICKYTAQLYIENLLLKLRVRSQFKSMARNYNVVQGPAPSKRGSIPGCSV